MKTTAFLHSVRQPLTLLACAGLLGLASTLTAASKEPVYENYIDIGGGYTLQSGDRAAFQKALQVRKDGFMGIEALRYSSQINDSTAIKILGKAMAGNADYLLDITITKDEVGYLKFGYKAFRTYYDGSAGVWPSNQMSFKLYDEDLYIDRSSLWFEAASTRPDAPSFVLRYELTTRKGDKDSTSWMDTGLPVSASATRYIVPTFLRIDEKRHVVKGTISKRDDNKSWEFGAQMDKGDYTNGRYSRRRPFETANRYVTAKEGQDYDTMQFRGSVAVNLTDKLTVTTAAARTKLETTLSGSRVNGAGYDAAYTTSYPGIQSRDEGFYALPGHELGNSEMTQTIANISVMYKPTENVSIVPAYRFERTEWTNEVEFIETNFYPTVTTVVQEETLGESEKHWDTHNYGVELRYTGIPNFTFNARGDISKSDGMLDETRILEPGTSHETISVDRETELSRDTQKVAFTANWYPRSGIAVAAQYYIKARQNDYRAVRDTTPNTITSSDRYPAYIANQDIETNDFNVRLSWRFSPNFRSVTRVDFAKTEIFTQDVGLGFGSSMENDQTIVSEAITWNPLPRWYVQGSVNLVSDELTTPAVNATGTAANLVTATNGDYTSYSLSSGYALDDQSDLFVDYTSFESRDAFINNSSVSTPYGTDVAQQIASIAWTRKLDRRTTVSLKYSYAKSDDAAYFGKADWEANIVQAKLQYRF